MRTPWSRIWVRLALVAGLVALAIAARAADDTARFYGTWQTTVVVNGQKVTVVSIHDASGYKNYVVLPMGNAPYGEGSLSALNGKWAVGADKPNDSGTYKFLGDDTAVCANAVGQTVIWKRVKTSSQPAAAPPAALRMGRCA